MTGTLPLVVVMLAVAFLFLRRMIREDLPDMRPVEELLNTRRHSMGKMSATERHVAILLLLTIIGWIGFTHELGGLAGVAILSVVIAFAFGMIEWDEVEQDVNWGVLLMYGGAITLGFAMQSSGAAAWIAGVTFSNWTDSPVIFIALISAMSIALTEAMSNAAVVALLMPIAVDFASDNLLLARMVTMAIAIPAGLAFVLPMATPALALAYSSGLLTIRDTVKYGIWLAVIAWIVFNVTAWLWLPFIELAPSLNPSIVPKLN